MKSRFHNWALWAVPVLALSGQSNRYSAREVRDREAIEELHRRDLQATVRHDAAALAEVIDDQVVALPPGAKPMLGSAAVRGFLEGQCSGDEDFEIVDYKQDWRDLTLAGDYAFEWGFLDATVRQRSSGVAVHSRQKVLRILHRSIKGEWKVYRTIWNDDAGQPAMVNYAAREVGAANGRG